MKFLKNLFLISTVIFSLSSCDNNDALLEEKVIDEATGEEIVKEHNANIYVSEDKVDNTLEATVAVETAQEVEVKVSFKSEETPMRRLYITENIAGAGATPYVLTIEHDSKGDGSIDLEKKYKKGFDFVLKMVAPELTEGTVEYKFWTTTRRGDFRNDEKNRLLEVATVTFTYGKKKNTAKIKEYSAKILAAPLADGTSKTFISLFDGKTYKISEGVEFAAFWDFGYFYGVNASLHATSAYNTGIFKEKALAEVVKAIKAEGNTMKFKLSDKDADFFTNLSTTNLDDMDIDAITATSINKLEVGSIVEFVDNYGKRGFMKVTGLKKTYNRDGFIKLDIKMQS